ncbi:MAG TPA: MFS transporter [Desulfobacteraceae bacterium]|nr:MFS transporter [Desulfobacteraceae bacterium]HPJ67817.1 MFS transporter [Desulfobacteraceae bacterium]HPQ29491.1 MFS transporter [Desulfobacteraceae bacterium]
MKDDPKKKMLNFRFIIFLILSIGYLLVYFHRLSLSVVADDLVRDFNTSASMMGLLGSVYFYIYALMQFPAGLMSDSLGPRKCVTSFLLIASAGSIIFGFAPNITVAFAGRILVGLGVSMVFIPTMKILAQWFRAREFALMAGILNAMGGMGVLSGTWLLALMAAWIGWRASFVVIGVSTLVLVVAVWFIVSDKPEDKGWPSIDEIDNRGDIPVSPPESIPLLKGAKIVVSEKFFWPIAIWFFFDCGIFFGFGGLWGGPYLMHVYNMTKAEAGAILSMIAWGMIIGSPLLGLVSDKVLKSRKKVFIITSTILTLEMIFLYIFPSGLPRAVLYILFFIFALCSSSIVVVGFTAAKELFPVQIAGTSVGTVNLFPFLGGAVFMPILGRILDAYPKSPTGAFPQEAYSIIILILMGASLVSLICTFVMKETYPKDDGNQPVD